MTTHPTTPEAPTSPAISEAAVEAALGAFVFDWASRAYDRIRDVHRWRMREALVAALPHLVQDVPPPPDGLDVTDEALVEHVAKAIYVFDRETEDEDQPTDDWDRWTDADWDRCMAKSRARIALRALVTRPAPASPAPAAPTEIMEES